MTIKMTKQKQKQKTGSIQIYLEPNPEKIIELLEANELVLLSCNGYNSLIPKIFYQSLIDSKTRETYVNQDLDEQLIGLTKQDKQKIYNKLKQDKEVQK